MKRETKEKLLFVFDVLFVLILCFVVLLATMILTKGMKTGATETGYHIVPWMLVGAFGATGAYLLYMVKRSTKQLHELTQDMLKKEETKK